MQFTRKGDWYAAARITGPRHHYVEVLLSDQPSEPRIEFLPGVGECRHEPLSAQLLSQSVRDALQRVNGELGTSYAIAIARIPVNDTGPEVAHGALVAEILRRIAAGERFEGHD